MDFADFSYSVYDLNCGENNTRKVSPKMYLYKENKNDDQFLIPSRFTVPVYRYLILDVLAVISDDG